MNYITSALAIRPLSAKSQESLHNSLAARNNNSVPDARSQEQCATPEDDGTMTSPKTKRPSTLVRTRTILQFCHPPPTTKQKRLHSRPKVLLQLHRTSKATRPTPAFDVLLATAFASRLAKEFHCTLKGKHGLGVDDLVVVGSEDYSSKGPQREEADYNLQKDNWKSREIVAAISHHSGDDPCSLNTAEICLSHERKWIGSQMPKGGYEFVNVDRNGQRTVARWIPRRGSRRQSYNQGASCSTLPLEERAFNFSLIDPKSRRHAVIATFDAQALEISDRYSTPTVESTTQPSATTTTTTTTTTEMPPIADEKDCTEVDEALRTLITVTSIWVSFREGFFGHDTSTAESAKAQGSTPTHKQRSLSMNVKDVPKNSTTVSHSPNATFLLGRPSSIQESASNPTTTISPTNTPLMSPPFLTPPRRTQSTGTSVLDRLHSRGASVKETETLNPISDAMEIPSFNRRTSAKSGQDRSSRNRGRSPPGLSAHDEEQKKRPKGFKKLYRSFKNSGSSIPSV